MEFDVKRARAETPGCQRVTHFNNAGAALMPKPVLDSVIDHLRLESEIGGYEAADVAAEKVDRIYDAAAELINCAPHEIAVIENATRAWDMAFYSIPFAEGDVILTSKAEYASNFIAYLHVKRRTGAEVEVIPDDEYGRMSVKALRNRMDERVKLISLTHTPTNGGLVNPAEEVGRVAAEAGTLYLLDACQTVGQMDVDVKRIGCHMLSTTSRKFLRGPRGVGFLYVDEALIEQLDPPFLDLHAATWVESDRYEARKDARRFENWETNYAGKVGFGVAMDYALEWGIAAIEARVKTLAAELRTRLSAINRVAVKDRGLELCGIVSFTVDGVKPEDVQSALRERNINVAVSPYQYTLIDMTERDLMGGVVRASVHYYNTIDEIDALCEAVKSTL